jgi:hypothetical protein
LIQSLIENSNERRCCTDQGLVARVRVGWEASTEHAREGAYDASLRKRGSLTVWFTDEAIAAWWAATRTTRGGQPWYSPLAILTALTLRAVFLLALRQTEGLIGSIIGLLGLTLAVPDHSTLVPTPCRCHVAPAIDTLHAHRFARTVQPTDPRRHR